jgi:hypothetical protein
MSNATQNVRTQTSLFVPYQGIPWLVNVYLPLHSTVALYVHFYRIICLSVRSVQFARRIRLRSSVFNSARIDSIHTALEVTPSFLFYTMAMVALSPGVPMLQAERSRARDPLRLNEFSQFTSSFRPLSTLGFTQPLTEMSTRSREIMFVGSRARPVLRADNLAVICEPTL